MKRNPDECRTRGIIQSAKTLIHQKIIVENPTSPPSKIPPPETFQTRQKKTHATKIHIKKKSKQNGILKKNYVYKKYFYVLVIKYFIWENEIGYSYNVAYSIFFIFLSIERAQHRMHQYHIIQGK